MTARRLPVFLLLLLTGLTIQAEAQRGGRGGRGDGSRRRPNPRATQNDLSDLKFQDRLWYGAGGTLWFQGGTNYSRFQIGLTPQVGYKFTEWFSAGPRFGATFKTIKDVAQSPSSGARQIRRHSGVDFVVGGFARARYRQFYVQGEFNALSLETAYGPDLNRIPIIDDTSNEVITERLGDQQLQIGAGYAPQSGGGLGSDIGLYYNLFADSESINRSAIELRFQVTFQY